MTVAILALNSYLFYGSLHAADLASSQYALRQPLVAESNAILRGSLARQLAIKAAATYGMGKLESRIPKGKRWIPRVILGLGYGYIVYHNLRLTQARR